MPTRLSVSLQGPGTNPEPGCGYRAGPVRSRSAEFPVRAYRGAGASATEAARLLPTESAVASAGGGGGASALDEPAYAARIGALVDAVASVVARWAADDGEKRVAQLTLTASGFKPVAPLGFAQIAPPRTASAAGASAAAPERGSLSASHALRLDDFGDIDPSVFAELPSELQSEIRAAIAREAGARGEAGARRSTSPPGTGRKLSQPQPPGRAVSPGARDPKPTGGAGSRAAADGDGAPRCKQARISSFFAPARSGLS
jgi:hypothetical protein